MSKNKKRRNGARPSVAQRKLKRQFLLDKYGDGLFVDCQLKISDDCEPLLDFNSLTIDRIIPGVLGGTYRNTNIQPVCNACGNKKSIEDKKLSER